MSARGVGGFALLGLGAAAYYLLGSPDAQKGQSPTQTLSIPPPSPGASLGPDDAHDDETALARMLASETESRGARIVLAWITRERAARAHQSLFDFLTVGKGYGHQDDDEHRHASTFKKPTAETRTIARSVLAGDLRPSLAIRRHKPGSWVERRQQGTSDDRAIYLQAKWREGIYARLAGTQWLLYSQDTAAITVTPYVDATARLDALPQVAALDPGVA